MTSSTALHPTVERYKEIATEPVALVAVPAEQRILDKLVWPLRHAKASYMVGNYLAVIALAGMVAEMVTFFTWEVAEVPLNGRETDAGARRLTTEDQRPVTDDRA